MQRSTSRILTTHAGSLPRTPALVEMLVARSRNEAVDDTTLDKAIAESTRRVVAQQLAAGIDVGNDGEQARESFFTYVQHRMTGFGGTSVRPPFKDIVAYPSFRERFYGGSSTRARVSLIAAPQAIGAVQYVDRQPM